MIYTCKQIDFVFVCSDLVLVRGFYCNAIYVHLIVD